MFVSHTSSCPSLRMYGFIQKELNTCKINSVVSKYHMYMRWEYVKDFVCLQPVTHNFEETKEGIAVVMSTIEGDKLQMVWDELDYRTEAFAV